MKIYIAGKITGDSNYQQKFMNARQDLEKRGHIVISPAVLPEGMTPKDYMKICFAMIDVADAVAFLPDWKDSAGARQQRTKRMQSATAFICRSPMAFIVPRKGTVAIENNNLGGKQDEWKVCNRKR